jgi:hypothetical protein
MPIDERPAADSVVVPRLLTVAEVADVLGVCCESVRRAIWRVQRRSVRIGRAVRVRVVDLSYFDDVTGPRPRRVAG